MKKYRIGFFGTPDFGLEALEKLDKNHDLRLIVCQPDRINSRGKTIKPSPIKTYGIENNIPVLQPEDINTGEIEDRLKEEDLDFIVVVAYGQYIGPNIRNIPSQKIVNIHGSLLPKYRGAAPIHRAIMDREDKTGVSIMEVGKGMDMGEVYLKKETPVASKTLEELYYDLSKLGAQAIIEYLDLYAKDEIIVEVQDESKATYANKITRQDGKLDFISVHESLGKILALSPRPGAKFNYKGEEVKALNGKILKEEERSEKPGQILAVDDSGIEVACSDGAILINKIQFPSARAMDVSDYIKGNTLDPKENLSLE